MPEEARYDNPSVEQPKLDLRADYEPDAGTRLTLKGGLGGFNGATHTGIGPFITEPGSYSSYVQALYRKDVFDANWYGTCRSSLASSTSRRCRKGTW